MVKGVDCSACSRSTYYETFVYLPDAKVLGFVDKVKMGEHIFKLEDINQNHSTIC